MNRILLLAFFACLVCIHAAGGQEQEQEAGSLEIINSQIEANLERTIREAGKKNKDEKDNKNKKVKRRKNKGQGKKKKGDKVKGKRRKNKKPSSRKNKNKKPKGRKNKNKKPKGRKNKNKKPKGRKNKNKKPKGRKNKNKKPKGRKNKNKKPKGRKNKNKKPKGRKNKNKKPKSGKNKNKDGKEEKKKDGKSRKNKKNKNKAGVGRQSCPVTDACLVTGVTYWKLLRDKVTNYKNQLKRVERQAKVGGKKLGKKTIFEPFALKVTELGGGNSSSLSCAGSTTGTGATNLKALYTKLKACSADVDKVCNETKTLTPPPAAETTACNTAMTEFETKVTACYAKTGAEACTCLGDSALATLATTVRGCDLSSASTQFTSKFRACTTAFASCKTLIDDAGPTMHSCNVNKNGVLSKLKSLSNNKDKVNAANTKIKSLASSTKKTKVRGVRALTTCAAVVTAGNAIVTLISEDSSSPSIATKAAEISSASVTCTASEKTQLSSVSTSMTSAVATIESDISTAQATLLAQTGSTASSSVISAASDCKTSCDATSGTATNSSKRRRFAVDEILKNQIFAN